MKTLQDITHELANAGLPLSQRSVRRKLTQLNIRPISNGFRPAHWPDYSIASICALAGAKEAAANPNGLPTLRTLRAVAARAKSRSRRGNGGPHHD